MVKVDLLTLLMGKTALALKLEENPTKQDEIFDFVLDALIEEELNFVSVSVDEAGKTGKNHDGSEDCEVTDDQ